ncbi:hypothetical protein H2200_008545 [Cladophialophora chaetospira]|uniref:Uncharacterized protein n=1 Tax=Cladophialophora chaetospira TaxID=386627 RepID=A0AA38X490_9EURO|nr:hypothetical protein H2200_008545 [Cladophialophora chaetospira]
MAADKNKPTFSTDLLWVNHDAQNMQTQPHRQRVFSHIQQRYRPWQRKDCAQKLRKAARVPTSTPRRASLDSEEEYSESSVVSPTSSHTTYGTDLGASPDHGTPRSVPDVKPFRGNSDPFDAYPIHISARVNDILRFYRDIVLPSQYHTGPDGWLTLEAAADDWRDVVRSLHEKGGALGFLARWAQVAATTTTNPALALQSLKFRSQSTSELLKKVQQEAGIASRSSYWHIIALYMAEAQAGNSDAAWIHAAMLSRALKHEKEHGEVDITPLRSFMYNEACACCMFLRKPVLDYDQWLPSVFERYWTDGRALLPAMQLSYPMTLDSSLESEFLTDMFMQQRESLAVWRHGSERAEGLSPAVFTWWCSSHLVKHTRLLKYGLDCVDAAKEMGNAQTRTLEKNAYLALTAVYWTRLIAGDETLLGKEIFQTKKPLRQLTRQLLEKERHRIEFTRSMQYANARLWALYVGAQAEHDQSGVRKGHDSWFSLEFTLQAARMGLPSWNAVHRILEGFLDCDVVGPHGSHFVPALLLQPTVTIKAEAPTLDKAP